MVKINLECPINSLGYGQVGLNVCKSLVKASAAVTLFPLNKPEITNESDLTVVQNCANNLLSSFDPSCPTVKIYHQFMLASHVGHGPYFGWPIFELDTFSPLELAHLSVPNSLIECSEWAKKICERYHHNVQVVPLGYGPAIFFPHIDRQPKEKSIFFNCGKWETRKGHDILIKAFLDAFEVSDNVELWMMPTNPFLKEHETKRWETLYTKNKLWSKVKLLPRVRSHIEVADVMRYMDCGVFPARAEGWNLEALEMLAEKELIITDYSAHSMYAHDNNSHIINITQIETALGVHPKEFLPGSSINYSFRAGFPNFWGLWR